MKLYFSSSIGYPSKWGAFEEIGYFHDIQEVGDYFDLANEFLKKAQLNQQLIKDYQIRAKNKRLQKMLQTYGEMSWEDLNIKLGKQENKDGKSKK